MITQMIEQVSAKNQRSNVHSRNVRRVVRFVRLTMLQTIVPPWKSLSEGFRLLCRYKTTIVLLYFAKYFKKYLIFEAISSRGCKLSINISVLRKAKFESKYLRENVLH